MEWEIVYSRRRRTAGDLGVPAWPAGPVHPPHRAYAHLRPGPGNAPHAGDGQGPVRVALEVQGGNRPGVLLHSAHAAGPDAPRLREKVGQDASQGVEACPRTDGRGTSG